MLADALVESPLHRVVAVADAGRVEQRHRIAVEIEMHLDHVPRRPGTGDTMATSRLAIRLSSVDLPAFGGPAIATTNPSRSRSPRPRPRVPPRSRRASSRAIFSAGPTVLRHIGLVGKIDARLDQRQRLDQPRAPVSARSPSRPFICRYACRRCASVSAPIRSARPSTAVRSSLPFSKARRVNSPASAGRKPSIGRAAEHRGDDRAAAVKLQLGHVLAGLAVRPGKPQRQRLVDHFAAAGSRTRARPARRGSGTLPDSALSASPARGPEKRTTAIAAGGRPEERA